MKSLTISAKGMTHVTVTPTSGHIFLLKEVRHIHLRNVVIQMFLRWVRKCGKSGHFLEVYDSRDGSSVHRHVSKQFSITIIN